MRPALAMLLMLAAPAGATQEYLLPTLFDVTGVQEGDALNVRAAPSTRAEIVGRLAYDGRDIEVVAHDPTGAWGQVNLGERPGWAAMRYLAYRSDVWMSGALPEGLRCLGTEPFWSLTPTAFSTPEAPDLPLRLTAVLDTGGFRNPRRAMLAEIEGRRLTASIVPAACSDGMSDRAYGLTASVIVEGGDGPALLTGCCSIAPQPGDTQ